MGSCTLGTRFPYDESELGWFSPNVKAMPSARDLTGFAGAISVGDRAVTWME